MFVEDCTAIDVIELARKMVVAPGRTRRMVLDARGVQLSLEFDMGLVSGSLRVETAGRWLQTVALELRTDRLGRRKWRFIEADQPFQKLYFTRERFASRRAHGLRYRVEAETPLDRLHRRHAQAQAQLRMLEERSHIDEALLDQALDEVVVLSDELDRHLEIGSARVLSRHINRARRRAQFSRQVEHAAAMLLANPRRCDLTELDLAVLVEQARGASGKTKAKLVGHFQSDKKLQIDADQPHLSLPILNRLGLLKLAALSSVMIGWPDAWIGRRGRRLDLVLDRRSDTQSCAVMLIRDGEETLSQLFWLNSVAGDFGRNELRWVCPQTRRFSKVLLYSDGRFFVPTAEG